VTTKRSDPLENASAAAKRLLPWLVAVAFFMESLDTTILNTAVPAISAALGAPPLSMKAVLASYTLSLAVFIPISGWMADRFGTRRGAHTQPEEMIRGIHKALLGLGILTIASTIVFHSLKSRDGDDVSQHKVLHPGG
jgi:MFS family permease